MNNLPAAATFTLFLFLFHFSSASAAIDDTDTSVNCGSSGASTAGGGKEWRSDVPSNLWPPLQLQGSTVIRSSISGGGALVPYRTARLSRSQFSYSFNVTPGQKILRLHFNPTSYRGFKRFNDLFEVEAAGFTLLGNFSASLTADSLGLRYFVKEFCIYIEEDQLFDIVFYAANSQFLDTYAFINGIEIISVPTSLSYFHGRHVGVEVLGKSVVNVDNSTALEIIRRFTLKHDSVTADDPNYVFGMGETASRRKESKVKSVEWQTSVDVGFRYLVRLHFSELGLKMAEMSAVTFKIYINDVIVDAEIDSRDRDYEDIIPWYRDYMVTVKGHKREGKRGIIICLQSNDKFIDGHGLLEGFEIMKLSNSDNSLSSPNPLPSTPKSSNWILNNLCQLLGHRNMIATVVITLLAFVNIIIHVSRKIWEYRGREEKNMPLIKAGRLCRRFSLAEMESATRNFSDAHLIGRGGFGKVYRGLIDNGQVTVAIKRLKSNSNQGQREFLTEIETLTELRHVNLVSLIGYCYDHREMILVYDYMANGTLSDHLYKLSRKGIECSSLTWKEHLNICIGAARGLDYLHTGHSLIHRDVKASNILLDESFVAKVADFGLARHMNMRTLQSHISTKVKGTFGYLDPSYYATGKLTRKSDTFSFGVVLLEVICGRQAVDPGVGEDAWLLTTWARGNISKGNADQIVSPDLRGEISKNSLKAFLDIAERCLHDEPKERPTMAQVVLQLQYALEQQASSSTMDGISSSNKEASLHGDSDDNATETMSNYREYMKMPQINITGNEAASSSWNPERVAMADAAVEFLLENLQQLLLYHVHLIKDVKEQVERMERDLRLFKSFLKESSKKHRREESLSELVSQICYVVYEAEDVIDAFVTLATERRSKNHFVKPFQTPFILLTIAKEVEKVGFKVRKIYDDKGKFDFASLHVGYGGPEESEVQVPRQDDVVGFEDEAEKIIGYIKEDRDKLDVLSIIGMPGIGKTTLAWKIFHDPYIHDEFPTRIWVYLSQEFTKKDVFLAILKEMITRLSEDLYQKTDNELALLVTHLLESQRFLIVMDDVWTSEDWDKIKIALPKTSKMGKVLITSRHKEVAWHANRVRGPHNMRFLTQEESELLLQLEVFGRPEWPSVDIKVLGKVIAEQCGGLPLAIVVIGGILAKKFSASREMRAKVKAWDKVSQSIGRYLTEEDPTKRMEKIIALSYDKLPFHLRACFLYFGMFPEDYEISTWKLIRMWIAEGFIQPKTGLNLEETAESYLEELINRNLVRVETRKPDGKVKTCRIHDMLRDFCKSVAGHAKEKFLQEMKKTREGDFEPVISNAVTCRRLCIHSNISSFVSSIPFGPHVRSFVCFSKEEINLPPEQCSYIPAGFKLLRVLEVKPIKMTKIPSDLYHLVHLRYITLSCTLAILPTAFGKLWNLQTLVVDTTSHTLDVKADIWKLLQLRHLKTNACTILPKSGKIGKEGEKLQTLSSISPMNCSEDVLDKCCNLKELGIRGRLSLLLDGKTGSFESLGRLHNLERLKLVNDMFPSLSSEGKLGGLPPTYQFPPKLRILTLTATFLDWSDMPTLGLLGNLEVLKLKDNAFVGDSWSATDGGFRHLEVLHIRRTDLLIWEASAHHFPRLRCLVLRSCEKLRVIPIGLADIPSFELLDLNRTQCAAVSAKKIQEKKIEDAAATFKLSIFPPVNDQ